MYIWEKLLPQINITQDVGGTGGPSSPIVAKNATVQNLTTFGKIKSGFKSPTFWLSSAGITIMGASTALKFVAPATGPLVIPLAILGVIGSWFGNFIMNKAGKTN